MNIVQYTFQSPSPNQVQVGRLVPSSAEQNKTKNEQSTQSFVNSRPKDTIQTLKNNALELQKVKPVVSANVIDTYA